MSLELNLSFPDKEHVVVRFDGEDSGSLPFTNPLTHKDRRDMQWYLEVYGAHSLGDPDDTEARRIAKQLPVWGKALFKAVFSNDGARRLFNRFQDSEDHTRLLTINAEHPAVLALPWELLHDPSNGGVFLFNETPRISIRRRVAGATGGRAPFKPKQKDRLHLLFVVSRPKGAGFLDPRADAQAVLDALEEHAPGRFTWEFLPRATIGELTDRLEDRKKPPVDILHFDGHGVFDRHGGLPELVQARKIALDLLLGGQIAKERKAGAAAKSPANTGYLVFENADGGPDLISAERLGQNLHRHEVALIILSACQTAALGDNEQPMGCVAARLTAAGIPAVLAMTHSVLVPTTRALFGAFYKDLARGRGIGEALDNSRRHLYNDPKKYEVQRGKKREWLELQDWFVPALYHSGDDLPLLRRGGTRSRAVMPSRPMLRRRADPPDGRVPEAPESGFFGRRHELWDIERWFTDKARRVTITGFGGQGKTALALEAGRWLTRTGMFQAAVFVDYSRIQSLDAAAVAVSNIGSVLGESLIDAKAAEAALKKTPTLVILDNLEALEEKPLRELLDAAVGWSEAGGSRVLCTTRTPDFGHPDYRVEGTLIHQRVILDGLGSRKAPDDALEWFAELTKLPPKPTVSKAPERGDVIELFEKVKFHPLSIRVLAQQLKTRPPDELGERLEELLLAPISAEGIIPELAASIQLSLDRLDEAAGAVLPRLGVFQGGAMEPDLLAITEIDEQVWPALRRQLEAAALIEAEELTGAGVPFLRFHPTLAPMLWSQLSAEERERLSAAHRERYCALAAHLYHADTRSPHEARAMALRELPNLLHAVLTALGAGNPGAVGFADSVNEFLTIFGLKQESEALVAKAEAAAGEPGSHTWYLAQSSRGEQLLAAGRVAEAAEVFRAVLEKLGDATTYERAVTLACLGRCANASGRPDMAEQHARDAIAVCDAIEQTDQVKRHRGVCLTDLADALAEQGRYPDARKAYEDGLKVALELGDTRQQGVILGQLGTLAMLEGDLNETAERFRGALTLFQQLREPAAEAVGWHQLGVVFSEARQWEEAEQHYRESARIKEQQGDLAGAAQTWNNLAVVSVKAGRPEAAEMWYQKAVGADRKLGNPKALAPDLNNLADLLRNLPGRLAEARELAEEALAIKRTLDPGAAEIWKTYGLLAEIADKEAGETSDGTLKAELQAQAREYRRLAREALWNFPGTRHALWQRGRLILAAVLACSGEEQARRALAQHQAAMRSTGESWANAADVLDRVLAGEQDPEVLCADLDFEASMIVEAILQGLADPSTLHDLLPDREQ